MSEFCRREKALLRSLLKTVLLGLAGGDGLLFHDIERAVFAGINKHGRTNPQDEQ
jgi:hypothetical protein